MRDDYGYYLSNSFTDTTANDFTESNQHRWDDVLNFLADFKLSPFYTLTSRVISGVTTYILSDNDIKVIYWLLYANYGNSHRASDDETRFKQQLFSIMYRFAPTWLKKMSIQEKLRDMSLDSGDLFKGNIQIYNNADNPQTTPSADALDPLTYINNQSANGTKKGKLEAYSQLWALLEIDVTKEFLDQFRGLFIKVASPIEPILYCEDN